MRWLWKVWFVWRLTLQWGDVTPGYGENVLSVFCVSFFTSDGPSIWKWHYSGSSIWINKPLYIYTVIVYYEDIKRRKWFLEISLKFRFVKSVDLWLGVAVVITQHCLQNCVYGNTFQLCLKPGFSLQFFSHEDCIFSLFLVKFRCNFFTIWTKLYYLTF